MEEDDIKDTDAGSVSSSGHQISQKLSSYSLKGSFGGQFDGDSPYFYNQFELNSPEQKWMQIVLLQDAIHRIKENFNKEFDQIMQRKLQDISKVKEKNLRLKQIKEDLNEEKVFVKDPALSDVENPELLFEIKDDEVRIKRLYISVIA